MANLLVFVPKQQAGTRWSAGTEVPIMRKLIWIEQPGFGGFGCSECRWRFELLTAPAGTSFEEMKQNFGLERDKEFTSHVCADYPRRLGGSSPST